MALSLISRSDIAWGSAEWAGLPDAGDGHKKGPGARTRNKRMSHWPPHRCAQLNQLPESTTNKVKRASWGANLGSTMDEAAVSPRFIAYSVGLAAVVMVVFAETAQAQVPTINIQETCRAAAGVMVNLMGGSTTQKDVEICLETENKARQQMLKDWSTYHASDREGCIQANVYLPSYTEWVTCFEMNKSVREARQQRGREMIGLTNPDGSVTMPSVRSLGINMRGGGRY
jgi:hypothetical protein